MSIVATDIQYFKSSQTNSDGGTISGTQIVDATLNNLWPDTTGDQAATGNITFRKIFVKNNHGTLTLTDPVTFILQQADDDEDIAIALGTPSDTDGSALTYSVPLDKSSGLTFPDLAPGASQGIWIRRTTPAAAAAFPGASARVQVEGDSL